MKKYLIALVLMVPVLAFGADDQSTINPPVVTCDTAVISGMAVDNFDQPGQETFQVFLDGKDVENLIKTNKSYVWFWEAKIEGAAGEHEIILYGADRNQELRFTVPACEPTPSVSQSSGVSSSGRHGSRALTHDQMCAKGLFDAKECAGKDLWAKFVGLLLALQK